MLEWFRHIINMFLYKNREILKLFSVAVTPACCLYSMLQLHFACHGNANMKLCQYYPYDGL